MKGFPNQVADLGKLATAMQCVVSIVHRGEQAKNDGILGQELVRSMVAGTGHRPQPIEDYIRAQLEKEPDRQSFRTTARGLRELFRILGFIDDSGETVEVADLGLRAAGFAGQPMNDEQIRFWRRAIQNMSHDGGDGEPSHPYQVLLKLIARKPGIAKPKCALALAARNDSPEELARIVALVNQPEARIRSILGVSKSNWANAVKVLPKFAEQLGDVVRSGPLGGYQYEIADAPGRADFNAVEPRPEAVAARPRRPAAPRVPRASREVTPTTIGIAGTVESFDEVEIPTAVDPAVAAAAVRTRANRLRRHNLLVRKLATRLTATGGRLYEDPFDILKVIEELGILAEIKTLDGTVEDERERVREALSQLLYYEAFVIGPVAGNVAIHKIACFERPVTRAHAAWLNQHGIGVVWENGEQFGGDALAADFLGHYLEELR